GIYTPKGARLFHGTKKLAEPFFRYPYAVPQLPSCQRRLASMALASLGGALVVREMDPSLRWGDV
ncbi:MAG: hypothetical protein AB7G25_12990, partial [Sphingomonadaceae bacterium]